MEVVLKRIDKLGRIVLPMDFRKTLGLSEQAEVVLGIHGDTITVRSSTAICRLCGTSHRIDDRLGICAVCVEKIKSL